MPILDKLRGPRLWLEAALLAAAIVMALLGGVLQPEGWIADTVFFGAWCAALLLLLSLALRLPLRAADSFGGRLLRFGMAALACGVAVLANIAIYKHDVHFDVTRNDEYTAPPELAQVINSLHDDVKLTYFYNPADEFARSAGEALSVVARQSRHLHFTHVDLDEHPAEARALGVRIYNTAVIETQGRRLQVENTVDLHQMAFGLLRALNERQETACFITGHGEPYETLPPHVHYSHVETTQEKIPGAGEIIVGTAEGLDRLRLALTAFGYADKAITPATLAAIPQECAVVAEIAPRRDWAPGEAATVAAYLKRGGRLLVLTQGDEPVGHEVQELLGQVGLSVGEGVVLDPLNHYGTDPDKIAVPYYPTHPITDRIAMTVFPETHSVHLVKPPDGVRAVPLAVSSKDSYRRIADRPGADDESAPAPAVLAAALDGHWPGSTSETPFRLVVVGSSGLAQNTYFPIVSNGELVVSMIRWLAGDTDTPTIQPQRFTIPQILLTHHQMQAVFLLVEVMLPLTVMLLGAFVWWRRR
ncbi:MAG: Gldg family protein [Acetobacteraceae bacterium]|nr:Gldg family protein [Acetobacteraceae bacterium]MBV8577152.1 Gldg family protein [Acetobacteraceae bacterium]